jgi:DNA-binding MarR family transcriptional regulator
MIRTLPLILRGLWSRLPAEGTLPVTFQQLGILTVLCHDRLTTSELADRWGVSAPTMSKMVSLLVERGWLSREEDPGDRRRKLLSLTPSGVVAHKQVYEAVRDSVALSLDPLDTGQRAQVVAALDLLLSTLS